jgi:hypothetical protein
MSMSDAGGIESSDVRQPRLPFRNDVPSIERLVVHWLDIYKLRAHGLDIS